jgi:hypothetical protein
MPPKRPRAGAAAPPSSSRAPRAPSAGRGGGARGGAARGRGRGGRARALDEDVRDTVSGAADDDDGFDFDESGAAGGGAGRAGAGVGASRDDDDERADDAESGDAKRLRLARDYLGRLEADVSAKASGGDGDEEEDDDERRGVLRNKAVSQRLADDASLVSGTLIRPVAAKIIAAGIDEHAAVFFKSPQRVRFRRGGTRTRWCNVFSLQSN